MKKNLLYWTFIVLFSALSVNAQKVWDLGGNVDPWTVKAASTPANTSVVIDNLGLQPGPTAANFGQIETSAKTFASTPAYTSVNRWKLNGGGGALPAAPNLPKQRFLYFAAAGSVTVTVYVVGGGAGSRILFITDGTNELGRVTTADGTAPVFFTTPPAVVNGNVYIFGDQAQNIYRIEVTGPLGTTVAMPNLGINTFSKESDVTVSSSNNKVFFSNIKSKTNVSIYSLTGALVKSAVVTEDAGVAVENGVYIVKLQSAEGEKTTKVIVQ
jgi:hypothetical protein